MTLEDFREAAQSRTVEPGKRPQPYTAEQREFALEYARRELATGKPKAAILRALGISYTTLAAWQSPDDHGRKRFRRVAVRSSENGAGSATLVTPTGYRVEGLSLDDVVRLLKTL